MDQTAIGRDPATGGSIAGFRIDDLLVDLAQQRVTRDAEEIKLPGLSFELLVALARAAPRFVSVPALMDSVWAGAVVNPETVSQRVKLLRSALGDDATNARYIAGMRGRGYRLVATTTALNPMITVVAGSVLPLGTLIPAPLPTPRAARRYVRLVITFSVAVGVGLLAWAALGKRAQREAPTAHSAPAIMGQLPPGSVAVLPFATLNDEPAMHDLGLAMATAVHHRLAVQRDLLVVARGSSFAMEGTADVRTIGQRLGARYLVEGTVQRSDQKVRVTAELVDVFSGMSIRELQFDRPNSDVLSAQVEIANGVATALEATVQATTADYSTYGLEAYLAYIRGSALLNTRKFGDADTAVKELAHAVELAPRFAAAYPALALARFQQLFVRNNYNPDTAKVLWPDFYSLVSRALELDPNNGEAYFMRGKYKSAALQDSAGAYADYRRGMALNPNYAPGLEDFADFLMGERHGTAEALALLDRAQRVDPLSPRAPYLIGTILWTDRGDLAGAALAFRRTIEIASDFYPAYLRLAQLEWNQGRLTEGIRLAERGLDLEPGVVWGRMYLLYFYVDVGDLAAARELLSGMAVSPLALNAEALICTRAGKLDTAEQLLNGAIRAGTFDGSWTSDTPVLDAAVARSLRRHDYAKALRLIQPTVSDVDHPTDLLYDLDHVAGLVLRAAVEKAAGRVQASNELVRRVLDLLDKKTIAWYPGRADLTRAAALAVVGRNEDSIDALEKARTSAARIGWWDNFGDYPAFATLHGLPRFQAFATEAHEWAERERTALDAARAAHTIPVRQGVAATRSGC